eukprot:Em0011g666a
MHIAQYPDSSEPTENELKPKQLVSLDAFASYPELKDLLTSTRGVSWIVSYWIDLLELWKQLAWEKAVKNAIKEGKIALEDKEAREHSGDEDEVLETEQQDDLNEGAQDNFGHTIRHIPLKDRLAFALVLSSALRSAVHDNSEDAGLKLLMLPKCVLLAPKRAGRHHKPVPISRLCAQWSKETPSSTPLPGDTVLMLEALDSSSPVTSAAIKSWTDKDPVLSRVRGFVLYGNWEPVEQDANFKPFKNRELELSVQDGCILWGNRVVVPKQGRKAVLGMLHDSHPGITKMKALEVPACNLASSVGVPSPPVGPTFDFVGPFMGKQFIVLVDAHSKWLEVSVVSSCSSQQAIKFLRHVFSTHGLPEVLVSDNGSAFISEEFQMFVKRSSIRHITSAPYHPASNGLAERGVKSFKEALKKSSGDVETRLASFLFAYRLTPHSTTGVSPAELLLGRRPRSLLDSLHPDLASKVSICQERQKAAHDKHAKARSFVTGDRVYIRSFGGSPDWIPGVVTGVTKLALLVKLGNGKVVRRHVDHVRARSDADANDQQEEGEGRELPAVEYQSEEATVVGGGASRAPDTSVENTEAGGDDGVTSAEAFDSRESGLGRDTPPPPDGTDHSLSAQVQVDILKFQA